MQPTSSPQERRLAGRTTPSASTVVRRRLHGWLDETLARRLTLVVAGAGYGKTTLLRNWHPPAPLAWYVIGPRDRSLPVLVQGLAGALAPHLPSLPADLAAVGRAQGPDGDDDGRPEAAAGVLCDALARELDGDVVLVLDDVGELDGPASRFVEALCWQAPSRLHLVLASSRELPYRVDRLRAQGQVLELTGADLAFTPTESAAVVRQIVQDADASLAEVLHAATGGWPAVVRLAAEAVRSQPPAARTATIAGLHRPGSPLCAYLAEEILAHEPPATHQLLRTVGVLPRFVAELCVTLGVEDAEATLMSLARRGVFVMPDAAHPGWFRLTGLVREFVRERLPLPPERRRDVLAATAAWCERAGHLDQALWARLAAEDPTEIAGLLRRHGTALLAGGALDDLLAAVGVLAPSQRDTAIEQLAGEACRLRGDWDDALEHFRRAAGPAATLPPGLAWRMGLIHYLRGQLGQALAIFSRADRAQGDPADRALVAAWAASAHWLRGAAEPCAELAGQALEAARVADDPQALAATHTVLAMLAALRSDRAANDAHYTRALANAERAGDVLQIIRVRSNRASRYLEEGMYVPALRDVDAALALSDAAGYAVYQALALTNRGDIYRRQGRLDDALVDLEAAKVVFQRLGSRLIAYPLVQLGDVHWERGDASLAQADYEEAIAHAEGDGDAQGLVTALAGLAVVLGASDLDQARAVAERAVAQGEQMGLVRALLAVGTVAAAAGDAAAAEHAGEQAATAARQRRDRAGLAEALNLLGTVSTSPARARSRLEEAAAIWRSLGSPLGAARAELSLARRLAGSEEPAARELVGHVAATARSHGARVLASEAGLLETSLNRRAEAAVAIRALGGFRVVRAGAPISASQWPSHEARELLKILVARRGRPAFHATIAAALWPDAPAPERVPALVESLRATLDPDGDVASDRYIATEEDAVWLEIGALDIDVEAFLRDAHAGLAALPSDDALVLLTRTEAAYAGEALEENRTEDWAASLREEARTIYIAVARALAEAAVAAGANEGATRYLQRLLERDAYDEAAHLALVGCLSAAGRPGEARRRYATYRARMMELGLEPAAFPDGRVPQRRAPGTTPEPERGVLRREGDVWEVAYRGQSARLRHSRGLEHLTVLLARPGQEVHALELAGARERRDAGLGYDAVAGRTHGGDAGLPVLDDQAKASYRSRLEDLQDDLVEAERFVDDERAARAREEMDLLAAELAAAVGLGGRDRTVGSTAERARQATSKAVKVALGRIAEHLPALGEHLASTVHTGTYCSYTPDPRAPLHWEL